MSLIDPAKVVEALETIAAEEITPRFRNLAKSDITDKGGGDFVTRADEEAEKRLTKFLKELLPGSLVVGEEAAHADERVLERLQDEGAVWVIDPLDGTNNFARGNDLFASMVALLVKGESVFGAIHMPTRDLTAVAERGQGAFMGGQRLKTASPRAASEFRASVHTGYLPTEIKEPVKAAAKSFLNNEQTYCAGRVYVGLAEGALDGALFWRTKPWDHAMGTLILREAGGAEGFADGSPYKSTRQGRTGLIAASGPETWKTLRDKLFPNSQ
jgi:fructose-1,6-bisphosphatase/inositol monophosphatase family enzyme